MPRDLLEEIYDAHAAAVFSFLIRLNANEAEVKDILQELFIRLAQKPDLLSNIESPRSYLFKIAHRIAIDRMRRENTRQYYSEQAMLEVEEFTENSTSDSDYAWREEKIQECLAELPTAQRAVVVLKVWHELTFAQIAEVLEISADTAASRYRYGLERLRVSLLPLQGDLK